MTRLFGFLLVSSALVLGGVWVSAQVDLTPFQPNTPILSSEVNANFAALEDAVAALATSGVEALNALTGAVELVAGDNIEITVDPDDGTLTIAGSAAGGGSGGVEALNALTGAVELVAGDNIEITVDPDDGTLTIAGSAAGGESGDDIPSDAVMAFNRETCPDGWSPFAPARGRAIVGVGSSGLVGGTVGEPLFNLQAPSHSHLVPSQNAQTASSGGHSHLWANFYISDGEEIWESGNGSTIFRWGNGIDNEGSGIYPLAVDQRTNRAFYTSNAGSHRHDLVVPAITTTTDRAHLPYVQLLYCQRD